MVVVEVVDVGDEDPATAWASAWSRLKSKSRSRSSSAGVVAVTVAAGVVAVTGGQDCDTLMIGRLTGSGSELGSVPGATFWNVKV